MLLSAQIYHYELAKLYSTRLVEPEPDTALRLKPPVLYKSGPVENDRVLIPLLAQGTDIGTFNSGTLVIVPLSLENTPIAGNCSIIYTDAPDTAELFNACQHICERYNEWESKLNVIMREGEDEIRRILEVSACFLDNLLAINDGSFTSVCYARSHNKKKYINYEFFISQIGVVSPDYKVLLDKLKTSFGAELLQKQAVFSNTISGYECIGYSLYDGVSYGSVFMLQENRPFNKTDYTLMEYLGEYLQSAVMKCGFTERGRETLALRSLFESLLDSKHISKVNIFNSYNLFGFQPQDNFSCIALKSSDSHPRFPNVNINGFFERCIPMAVIINKPLYSILLVNVDLCRRRNVDWRSFIENASRDYELLVAVSDKFQNLQYSELYQEEAVAIMEVAGRLYGSGVYSLSDIYSDFILERAKGSLIEEQMYHPAFRRLLDYNDNAGASYVDTLRVFLEENMNYTKSASRLYISRNAFMSRLERLQRVLCMDLNEPTQRFSMLLSLNFYDAHQRAKKP